MTRPDPHELFDMTGRVAIVTGGSRGLGLSIARILAAAGARVVIASRRLDACERAASLLAREGGSALPLASATSRSSAPRSAPPWPPP